MQQHGLNLHPALGPSHTRRASQMRQAARLSSSGPFADQEPDQAEERPVRAIHQAEDNRPSCTVQRDHGSARQGETRAALLLWTVCAVCGPG
jgi:hypothetical protein